MYVAQIICSQLYIDAVDKDQAERKYNAYYYGELCPCGKKGCGCCKEGDEVSHFLEEINV